MGRTAVEKRIIMNGMLMERVVRAAGRLEGRYWPCSSNTGTAEVSDE